MTLFYEPWRSSVTLPCLYAQIPRVAVLLINNNSSKQTVCKKGSFSNCPLCFFLYHFHPLLKNSPFFHTVSETEFSNYYTISCICVNFKDVQDLQVYAFPIRGQLELGFLSLEKRRLQGEPCNNLPEPKGSLQEIWRETFYRGM